MEKTAATKKTARYGIRALCALLAVIISGLLVAGATFDWGNVHYSRITFTYSNNGNNGELNTYEGSAIMYVPKNATKETPAPAVLSIHGISSNAQSQSNYAIELARRGYVVMSVDLPGSGYTDMVGQNPPVKQDMTTFLDEAVKVLKSLNYVQQGNMTSFGFSGGVAKAYETAARHKDTFNLIIGGSGNTKRYEENPDYQGINKIGITSDAKMCGTPDTVTGSVEDGTYAADYYFRNYVTHVWMTISGESMYGICKYINEVNPAPIQIDPSNQVFLMAHFFSVLGYISVICFLITFTQFLLNTKNFANLKRAEFPNFNTEEPKWQKIAFVVGTMALNVLAMLILVVKLQVVPLDSGIRAIPLWFNVYVPYFIAIGMIDLLMFIFRFHFRFGKKQGGTLVAYDVLEEGGAVESVKSIAKALLIGFVVAGSIFAVLTVIESKLGVRFNFFDWALNVGPTKLLVHSWFYILMYLFMFVSSNLNNFVAKPAQDAGLVADIKEIAIKSIMSILPMLFLVGLNLGRGMGWLPGKTNVPMDHLYGYIFTIIIATIVNNVVTKKTKNIWAGAAVCAVYLGFGVTFGFALQATLFG